MSYGGFALVQNKKRYMRSNMFGVTLSIKCSAVTLRINKFGVTLSIKMFGCDPALKMLGVPKRDPAHKMFGCLTR